MIKNIIILTIQLYRKTLSPVLPGECRFYPTCSSYAIEAVSKYGAIKGGYLSFKRIIKCHPFYPGGYDPVMTKGEKKNV